MSKFSPNQRGYAGTPPPNSHKDGEKPLRFDPGPPPPAPYNPFSWSAGSIGSDCHVATDIYGNPNAWQLDVLRNFRDTALLNDRVGRAFVDFYYGPHGRRVAQFLREELPGGRPLVRAGLDVLVRVLDARRQKE
jgi:hypothetical protein